MSLATFFSFKHDKSFAHSHLWERAAQGFIYGHIFSSVWFDRSVPKWTEYGHTLLMSGAALHSMARNSFFKKHIEKVEYFRYAVLAAGAFNFLTAFFNKHTVYKLKVDKSNSFFENFKICVWNYIPKVLAIINMGVIALEAREKPMKALSCFVGFWLNNRDMY